MTSSDLSSLPWVGMIRRDTRACLAIKNGLAMRLMRRLSGFMSCSGLGKFRSASSTISLHLMVHFHERSSKSYIKTVRLNIPPPQMPFLK